MQNKILYNLSLLFIFLAITIQFLNHSGYIVNKIPIDSEKQNYKEYSFNNNKNKMEKTAKCIVIGGTGATGKHLIKELIHSPQFTQITSLVRKEDTNVKSEKLKQVVVDFEKLEDYKSEFKDMDVAFNVLGSTKKQAGSAERFREIDYGYAAKFSDLSKEAGVRSMHLLTSTGANPKSWFLYPRVKGEIEEKAKKDNFHSLSIYRPGFLERGVGDRMIENILGKVMSQLKVETLAKAMVVNAEKEILNPSSENKVNVYSNKEIYELVGEK